jgi:ferredoxin
LQSVETCNDGEGGRILICIDDDKCTGCGTCIPYCTTAALYFDESKRAKVAPEKCSDCWMCLRNKVCPFGAMHSSAQTDFKSEYRHYMSDPNETTFTGDKGRGTEEVKTNDVTGRVKIGTVGFTIDMGRPGIGARLDDVEKVVMAIVKAGVVLEEPKKSPLGAVIKNHETGEIAEEYKDIFVLSIIIEGTCPIENARSVLIALKDISKEIDTVFSLGIALRHIGEGAYARLMKILDGLDIPLPYRGKVNLGLGKPLCCD